MPSVVVGTFGIEFFHKVFVNAGFAATVLLRASGFNNGVDDFLERLAVGRFFGDDAVAVKLSFGKNGDSVGGVFDRDRVFLFL